MGVDAGWEDVVDDQWDGVEWIWIGGGRSGAGGRATAGDFCAERGEQFQDSGFEVGDCLGWETGGDLGLAVGEQEGGVAQVERDVER